MTNFKQIIKRRWLLLVVLAMASIVFTGCEKGSLGIKGGTAIGYVLDSSSNHPVTEVLVRAENHTYGVVSTYTGGDGSFSLGDLEEGAWEFKVEKFGYELVTGDSATPAPAPTTSVRAAIRAADTSNTVAATVNIKNGATANVSVIKMTKSATLYKGTLRGYPIDAVTGRPLRNFTVTQTEPYNERKSKLFDVAEDFRDSGWTGLQGGDHHYTISCQNYVEYSTSAGAGATPISIGPSAVDLGVLTIEPLTVNIAGTLRNLPGYILDTTSRDIVIWAESAGRIVASFTDVAGNATAYKGSVSYKLSDIPVTAGSVAIKCKIRGYDLVTIDTSVSLPSTIPGGTIAGIDADFSTIDPIRRDLRIVVTGSKPSDSDVSSFDRGEIARVYIRQGGKDIVPYTDVVSVNFRGEAYISGVITGYTIDIIVVNMSRGYVTGVKDAQIIQEDGNTAFTVNVPIAG